MASKDPTCYLCGQSIEHECLTKDHVPPQQFYPKAVRERVPLNLWVLPTHRDCNESYKADEEYFYHCMYPAVAKGNPAIGRIIFADLERRAKKPQTPVMIRSLLRSFRGVTKGGIFLPPGLIAYSVDEYRIQQVVIKIARGVAFKEHSSYVPLNQVKDVRFCFEESQVPELYQLAWMAAPVKSVFPKVFSYRCARAKGMIFVSMYFWQAFMSCVALDVPNGR